jgi:DNA-binding PadR family transcriptional regulator
MKFKHGLELNMRFGHRFGRHRDHDDRDEHSGHHGRHHHPGHHHRRGRHGGRLFDYGELRILLLAMIAERPRHGYELIKAIEERMGGSYTPSPGVIYPTLSWLEDMGYVALDTEEAGRKRYSITSEGEAFLVANRAAADDLLARGGSPQADGPDRVPSPVVRAMENLKMAMRLRLRQGPISQEAAATIAAVLDDAAKTIERT